MQLPHDKTYAAHPLSRWRMCCSWADGLVHASSHKDKVKVKVKCEELDANLVWETAGVTVFVPWSDERWSCNCLLKKKQSRLMVYSLDGKSTSVASANKLTNRFCYGNLIFFSFMESERGVNCSVPSCRCSHWDPVQSFSFSVTENTQNKHGIITVWVQ